ncbi:TonB-dependent hemoglobin/transferrin/lactoferrin family receptor [Shewanella algae]|uniref:TonB-dependent hemoglobin/transferrin/lactoferrin family receptor n=1 Tax=Shewanella algae TaxID=38313 RepID=UPI000BB5E131|nr:TonB-dependent hemoglobin/transferrin/lactoferrin family receptor [Shewanella algae]MBO2642746.1 TonB-dependent hemoglobin/transferrin/lactoferrin family receptor [Shewanella algae]MBO2646928.1 TonB-dependent hemoglobin/transferrin/lactoferrin family receptor [Shewanella algae]PBQ29748.1 TonB-dependent receptor [Shewanella algae]QNI01358.1 TonB-dependent hemoglobin/transferrin/lactoferrin family receptor [Shewanella algae]TVK96840.1 TonB-dependent receptor [Shewanella algae]
MNRKPLVMAITLALGTPFLSLAAVAEQVKTAEFDEVLVSATRIQEKVSESSRSAAVVGEEQLAEKQGDSVAEVLKTEANINIANGPRASAQQVEIRGLSGQRVLQTIDGARQNTSAGHRGTFFMDPELLSSVEVVRGPASSLWGSGAIGGVVSQNTKSAREMLDEGQSFGGYLKQGYETNGQRSKSSGAIYGTKGSIDWLLNGSYSDGDNIKAGNDNTLENSASRSRSGLAKFGWQLDEAQRLQLSGRINEISEAVPSNPATDVSNSVPLVRRESKDSNLTLDYSLAPSSNALLDLDAKFYWNKTDYDENRLTKGQFDTTEYETLGFSIANRSQWQGLKLTYGLDGYRDQIETFRDDSGQSGQRPGNIDGESRVWGAFVAANIALGENWSLDPALRYDSFENESNNLGHSSDDDALSPSLALVWKTAPWLTLSARYDEAFRAPSVEEMYSSGTHYCIPPIPNFLPNGLCNTFEVNENLKAEKAKNKELKADMRFAELAGNDELALSLSVFRNDVDDFIEQRVTNPLHGIPGLEQNTRWDNVDKARLTGFELTGKYRINQTRLSLSYGQTEGKDRHDGGYLANIPANKLVLDLSQGIMAGDMKLGTRVSYNASQDRVPEDNPVNRYQDYTLWDVYLAWEPAMGTFEGLRVDFAIENIGDEEYIQAWQTLMDQGRNFKLSARYRF